MDTQKNPFDWQGIAEDMLIYAYVPEAGQMTRAEALELALQRDLAAAEDLRLSIAA